MCLFFYQHRLVLFSDQTVMICVLDYDLGVPISLPLLDLCFTGVSCMIWEFPNFFFSDDRYTWLDGALEPLHGSTVWSLCFFCFKFLVIGFHNSLHPQKFNMVHLKSEVPRVFEVPLGNYHFQGNHVEFRGSRSFITLQDISKSLHNYQVIQAPLPVDNASIVKLPNYF